MNNLLNPETMLINITELTVFKNFLANTAAANFIEFLNSVYENESFIKVSQCYSDFIYELYQSEFKGDWTSFVRDFVLHDENVVSIECAKGNSDKIPSYIFGAFDFELRILSDIASISFEDVKEFLSVHYPKMHDAINSLPVFDSYKLLFTKDKIHASYKTQGYGEISRYSAFKFDSNLELRPVLKTDTITLGDLKLYDYQKNILKNNTLSFIKNKGANNVLLYGDRGCGKSSLVKAIANEYKKDGLKIVQIYKQNLNLIEELTEFLSDFPSKFIIFIDDLVFDENDPDFASCKALLEGSLMKHPNNIVIYATTNRRHLIKETFSSRNGDEVHLGDTMDEAASLSDRFGVTITFTSPDKSGYFEIVKLLAKEAGIKSDEAELLKRSEAFALLRGSRAPRIARQFILDYLVNNPE